MNPNFQHFRIDESLQDRITIWIDVQDKSVNTLSEPVFDELTQMLDVESRRDQHLPLVFRSAKPGSFVVGADLRRLLAIETDAQIRQFLKHGQMALDRLESFDGITIAVIHGPCLGGGLELALACDKRIAVDIPSTQLGMPEAKLGLMPGWGGTARLIETLGVAEGLPMLLTGESANAQRAYEIGLVDALIRGSELEDNLTFCLDRFHGHEPVALADTVEHSWLASDARAKRRSDFEKFDLSQFHPLSAAQEAIYRAASVGITQMRELGMQSERELFYSLLMSAEAQENLQRFINRSKPSR